MKNLSNVCDVGIHFTIVWIFSVPGLNSQHKVENTWFSNSFSISAHTCTSHDYNILINMILTDKTCNNKKEVWYDVTWWASSLGTLLLNRFTICGFWTSFRFFVWSIKVNVYSRYTRLKIQNPMWHHQFIDFNYIKSSGEISSGYSLVPQAFPRTSFNCFTGSRTIDKR